MMTENREKQQTFTFEKLELKNVGVGLTEMINGSSKLLSND